MEESPSRKRSPNAQGDEPTSKRRRIASDPMMPLEKLDMQSPRSSIVTPDELAKKGLRRSIGLVLEKVGFHSADAQAMEMFTQMAETYMSSIFEQVHDLAAASRRTHANPTDFELILTRFNVTTLSLKPHLRPPVAKTKRAPEWTELTLKDTNDIALPILCEELSGAEEKGSKTYIPGSFPSFPSQHTYKYTPEDVAAVTVSDDWGPFNPDLPSQTIRGSETPSQSQAQGRPLAPNEIPRGDPKKLREAAAKEARLGEEALRRLMRASKIAKQKEVWSLAQRVPTRKERYNLWESAMREAIEDEPQEKGKSKETTALIASHATMGRFEIADHSMIVNTEKKRSRRELVRPGTRRAAGEAVLGR